MKFVFLYILSVGIIGISVAWTTGGNNQTASIFAAKMNWNAEETRVNNTMINFASQIGKTLGAIYSARILQNGRKKPFIINNILSLITCMI